MKFEINAVIAKWKTPAVQGAHAAKAQVGTQFNSALSTLGHAMDDLKAKGVDPIKVPTERGNVNLRKTYDDIVVARDRALADPDGNLNTIQ